MSEPNAGTDDQSFATCNNLAITVNLDDFITFADKGGQWYLRDFTNPIPSILNLDDSAKDDFRVYYTVNNKLTIYNYSTSTRGTWYQY